MDGQAFFGMKACASEGKKIGKIDEFFCIHFHEKVFQLDVVMKRITKVIFIKKSRRAKRKLQKWLLNAIRSVGRIFYCVAFFLYNPQNRFLI